MKHITHILIFILSVNCYGQRELAKINDPDGYTNVRSEMSAQSQIVTTIQDGEIFECDPTSQLWWKVYDYYGANGYIHRSRIVLIKDLSDNEQIEIVLSAIQGLSEYRKQYANNSLVLSSEGRMNLLREFEHYEETVYSPLLKILSEQFCKNGNHKLMQSFLNVMIENSMSANELPSWALARCYICLPDTVMQLINTFPENDKNLLLDNLIYGFEGVTSVYNYDENEINRLKEKIDNAK